MFPPSLLDVSLGNYKFTKKILPWWEHGYKNDMNYALLTNYNNHL
jgi:hypothetical protein